MREMLIRKARVNFYQFCRMCNPKVYKADRWHLKRIADTMQSLYEGTLINEKTGRPYRNMTLSVPPGHAKSYTAQLFSLWMYGKDRTNQIITVSYNEKLSSRFGAAVRDGIEAIPGDVSDFVFRDVFPGINVKYGDASRQSWALEEQYMSYLASSFKGSITGMRGNIGIIDDPVRGSDDAMNDNVLDAQYDWYTDTFQSRMLEGAIQIIIATRWSSRDLIGRVNEEEPDEWYNLVMPALQDEKTGKMLCPDILSYSTYERRRKTTTASIFYANYDQKPMDVEGRLYGDFKEYDHLPTDDEGNSLFDLVFAYGDTADTGKDFLCMPVVGRYNDTHYLLDVLYSDERMEITEELAADMLYRNEVNLARIESNSGGRGFARSVERILREVYRDGSTVIKWFHQTKNKRSRIHTNAPLVTSSILFPRGWQFKYPEFYKALTTYTAKGINAHDDAPDAITGIVEYTFERGKKKIKKVKT